MRDSLGAKSYGQPSENPFPNIGSSVTAPRCVGNLGVYLQLPALQDRNRPEYRSLPIMLFIYDDAVCSGQYRLSAMNISGLSLARVS